MRLLAAACCAGHEAHHWAIVPPTPSSSVTTAVSFSVHTTGGVIRSLLKQAGSGLVRSEQNSF